MQLGYLIKTNHYLSATNQSFRKSIGNQNEYQVVPDGRTTIIVVKRGDVIKEHFVKREICNVTLFCCHSLIHILVEI